MKLTKSNLETLKSGDNIALFRDGKLSEILSVAGDSDELMIGSNDNYCPIEEYGSGYIYDDSPNKLHFFIISDVRMPSEDEQDYRRAPQIVDKQINGDRALFTMDNGTTFDLANDLFNGNVKNASELDEAGQYSDPYAEKRNEFNRRFAKDIFDATNQELLFESDLKTKPREQKRWWNTMLYFYRYKDFTYIKICHLAFKIKNLKNHQLLPSECNNPYKVTFRNWVLVISRLKP